MLLGCADPSTMSEEKDDGDTHAGPLSIPQQEQPFARFVYEPTAARALQQRRARHDALAHLSGVDAISSSAATVSPSSSSSSPTLIWMLDPSHRWVQNPAHLQRLLGQLLRGTEQHWTVLMYSSRAKAFQHAHNLSRAPIRPSDRCANLPPALQPRAGSASMVVHALVTTHAVAECWVHLAQPLSMPLIYFGTDPRELAEVYATASPALSTASRLDALFAIAESLRNKDEAHGAIAGLFGGIGRRGNSAAHVPYPALLASASSRIYGGRFLREAQQRWEIEEQARAEGDPVMLSNLLADHAALGARDQSNLLPPSEDDALESRPNSPDYLSRVAQQVFGRVAAREKTEAAATVESAQQQEDRSRRSPIAAAAAVGTRGSKRVGLADGAPTRSTSSTMPHSAAAVAASSLATAAVPATASSPFRQLSVELPQSSSTVAASTRIQVIDETGRVRPSSSSSSSAAAAAAAAPATASARGVHFASGKLSRTPKSGASGPVSASASTSSLLSPSRSVRNPFGTASGLPSPAQTAEILEHQVELGAPLVRPASALTSPLGRGGPPKPLELTEQTEADARAIQDIERLSAKLQAYDLPPSPSSAAGAHQTGGSKGGPRSGLPADTMPERFAAFAAHLNRSHILDGPTRSALLEDHARQLAALPRRNLYDLERARLGSIEAKAAHRAAWMAAHAQQAQELESAQSSALMLENDARVSSAMGLSAVERKYRQDLLAVDRLSLEDLARAQRAAKVEAYNAAQSTAAERALSKVPDAPKLTNLQAIFLSPASRHKQKQESAAAAAAAAARRKEKSWAPPSAPPNRPLRRGASLTVFPPDADAASTPAPAPLAAPAPTPLSPLAALASGSFVRPSASAIEAALRADFAAQESERRAAEKRQLELEAVLYSKAKQAKVNEWLASDQSRFRSLEAAEEDRNAAQETAQFKRMVRDAFGDTEDDTDAAARARKVQAQFGLGVVSQSHLAEEELQSRSRAKREAIFAELVPTLASDQARQDADAIRVSMDLARTEMIAKSEEKMLRELEDNKALQEIRKQRHAQWSKAHPPLPTHTMSISTRRVERRNPHEWHSEMMAN